MYAIRSYYGIDDFLHNLEMLTSTTYNRQTAFAARVYKIRHELQGTRLSFLKITAGNLRVRDEVNYVSSNGEEVQEKVTSLRIYNGEKFTIVDEAEAGQLIAVTGLSAAAVGDGLGELQQRARYELVPALKSKVLFDPKLSVREVQRYFQIVITSYSIHYTKLYERLRRWQEEISIQAKSG